MTVSAFDVPAWDFLAIAPSARAVLVLQIVDPRPSRKAVFRKGQSLGPQVQRNGAETMHGGCPGDPVTGSSRDVFLAHLSR